MSDKKTEALKLALEALELAQDNLRDHGDNCFLHDEGEYNRCFCGKDSLSNHLQSVVEKLDEALADNALDKMADNAKELGLDYEPIVEQVEDSVGMGHGAWDMVEPKKLAKAFHEALAEQPAQPSKPLTDEQIRKLWSDAHNDTTDRMAFQVFARLVESAHNIGDEARLTTRT